MIDILYYLLNQEIVEDVNHNGGKAILTSKNHKTGSDRIYEALKKINDNDIDLVMNLQGDEPIIDINDIINLNKKMIENNAKIGTLASNISNLEDLKNKNMVKVVTQKKLNEDQFLEAETFLRTSKIRNNIYHHIGIYCYKKETLEKFVKFKQSQNEIKNRLEQLRALDNNIEIKVALAKSSPIGVDTEEDYIALKKIMEYKS